MKNPNTSGSHGHTGAEEAEIEEIWRLGLRTSIKSCPWGAELSAGDIFEPLHPFWEAPRGINNALLDRGSGQVIL